METSPLSALGEQLAHDIHQEHPCNHTLDTTATWLAKNGYDVESALVWLLSHDIHCDCDVLNKLYSPAEHQ